MKIPIQPGSINPDELKSKLAANFMSYKFHFRTKNLLVAAKTAFVGANIIFKKDKIIVGGNFPSIGVTLVFTLSLVLLGILIPLIIYFAAFHGKLKKFEKEIGGYIQEQMVKPASTNLK